MVKAIVLNVKFDLLEKAIATSNSRKKHKQSTLHYYWYLDSQDRHNNGARASESEPGSGGKWQ